MNTYSENTMDTDFEVKCLQNFGFTSAKVKQIVDSWKHKAEYSCQYNKKRYNKRKFNENFTVTENEEKAQVAQAAQAAQAQVEETLETTPNTNLPPKIYFTIN